MNLTEAAAIALSRAGRPLRGGEIWSLIRELSLQEGIQENAWLTLEGILDSHCRHEHGRFIRTKDGSFDLRDCPPRMNATTRPPSPPRAAATSSELPSAVPFGTPSRTQTSIDDALDTSLLLEADLHRWMFRNLQRNGLRVLGYGPLRVLDERRQGLWNLGKFNTRSVGEIDMLLRTREGDLLVIELKRRGVDEAVGQICRYIGWVEHNLTNRNVFGLIIAHEITDRLRYAVRAAGPRLNIHRLRINAELGQAGGA